MRSIILLSGLFLLACDNSIPANPDKPGGSAENPVDSDNDGFNADVDCDDSDPAINPGAVEVCDLQDNDCDDLIDTEDDSLSDPIVGFTDLDSDGFGNPDSPVMVCSIGPGVSDVDTDCDDDAAEINPSVDEICDEIDNDCDGLIDDDDDDDMVVGTSTFYNDADSDGLGDIELSIEACIQPSGFVEDGTDCNDTTIFIGGPDDWYSDNDFDGYGGDYYKTDCNGDPGLTTTAGDCDDTDETINPDGTDYCGDDIDHDCSGPDDTPSSGCIDLEPQDILGTVSCSGDGTALTVAGEHIRVNYSPSGMWWNSDLSAGLEIMPTETEEAFADVTFPGTAIDLLKVSINGYHYSIGNVYGSDDFETVCAQEISVGDVVGAIHEYELVISGPFGIEIIYTIEKTELWNKSGHSMLVHLKFQPPSLAGELTSEIEIQRVIDPDTDYDSHGDYSSAFTRDLGTYLTMASGPSSDWTVGFGACSSDGKTGASKASVSSPGPVAVCDPDGETRDIKLVYSTSGTTSGDTAIERTFILSTGATPEDTQDEWDATKVDLCGDAWGHWMSPSTPDCYDGGILHEPVEGL